MNIHYGSINDLPANAKIANVSKLIAYEGFFNDDTVNENDIALIKVTNSLEIFDKITFLKIQLSVPINLNEEQYAKKICLAKKYEEKVNEVLVFAGWGMQSCNFIFIVNKYFTQSQFRLWSVQ